MIVVSMNNASNKPAWTTSWGYLFVTRHYDWTTQDDDDFLQQWFDLTWTTPKSFTIELELLELGELGRRWSTLYIYWW